MKQHQTKVSRLTRDVMILDLMNTMGWTKGSSKCLEFWESEQLNII